VSDCPDRTPSSARTAAPRLPARSTLAFLPDHVVRELERDPGGAPLGRVRRHRAVVLYPDVSGFTAMSEALAGAGPRGTEELARLMNDYFEPMIDLISGFRGSVATFSGDAISVLFHYRGDCAGAVRRAAHCALAMQRAMPRYAEVSTSAGPFGLRIRAGLAVGRLVATTVGDPDIRVEHVIAGRALDLASIAQCAAAAGEVIGHVSALEHLPDARTTWRRGEFAAIAGLPGSVRRVRPRPPPELGEQARASAMRYLHPSVAARLAAGRRTLLDEHRRVTVVFARLEHADLEHDPAAARRLQDHVAEVVRRVAAYGGHLRQVDMTDQAAKYILLFGAPVSHEDDAERALRCALELREIPHLQSAIAVNTGVVFCGRVGSDARYDYTAMGAAVNVAARLMKAAHAGQVLVTDATRRRTCGWSWRRLDPVRVKGRTEPIAVFEPLAGGGDSAPEAPRGAPRPLFGRAAELRRAGALLQRALRGDGRLLEISGEAGIGKTRLKDAVAAQARAAGYAVHAGACLSFGTTTSYLVWRDVCRGLLDVDPRAPAAAQATAITRTLVAIDPALAARAPLLAPLVGVPLGQTPLTRSLDPAARSRLLHDLVVTCVRALSGEAPRLLVLEDCHWIDPLSLQLLAQLSTALPDLPVVVLVLRRTDSRSTRPRPPLVPVPHCTQLLLRELPATELGRVVAHTLGTGGQRPPRAFMRQVAARAQGNPFYAEELVNLARDRGLDPRDAAALAALEPPDNLQTLILARIDGLDDSARAVLQVASVIGRRFDAGSVAGGYPAIGSPADVAGVLARLTEVRLVRTDGRQPGHYRFTHDMTQDVAYGTLAFRAREELHEGIAGHLERVHAGELESFVDLLAHHYRHSANRTKEREYLRLASEAARAAYANDPAIEHYGRLLALVPAAERPAVLLARGSVLQLVGRFAAAGEDFREALAQAHATGRREDEAAAQAAIGTLASYTDSYADAVTWLERARESFERLGDDAALSRVLERLALTLVWRSDYARARRLGEDHLRLARRLGDSDAESAAHAALGTIHWTLGDLEAARPHLEQALEIATRTGQKTAVVHAASDLAGLHADRGDHAAAVEWLDHAFAVASEIGYRHAAGTIAANAGELCRRHGDDARALVCYAEAMRIAAELGDVLGVAQGVGGVGAIAVARGSARAGHALLDHAITLCAALGRPWFEAEYRLDKARALAGEQRLEPAASHAARALALAAGARHAECELEARLLLAVTDARLMRRTPAAVADELERVLATSTRPADRAAVLHTLWRLDPRRDRARDAAAQLYRELHGAVPRHEYRIRYHELSGDRLPAPAPLPPLAGIAVDRTLRLDTVLRQARQIVRATGIDGAHPPAPVADAPGPVAPVVATC
jgi:class 3 adenylate cyclase/tetratricopeptide (TPR) repeat protein